MRYVLHPWGPELVEPPPNGFDLLRRLAIWSRHASVVGLELGLKLRLGGRWPLRERVLSETR